MNLTQAQVRGLVGVTEEQFRSWRSALPPLKGRPGQSPQFGLGDVWALFVIADLVENYGAKVSKFGTVSGGLFALCNKLAEEPGMVTHIIFSPSKIEPVSANTLASKVDRAAFVVPLGPIRDRITRALFSTSALSEQLVLEGI